MSNKKRTIVFSDGSQGSEGDFPVALTYEQEVTTPDGKEKFSNLVVDPIFNGSVTDNLYGRIMTLVEATTEPARLKAVKDVFSKELGSWASMVYDDAREIARGVNHGGNIYNR